jgi:hypothetical protein
VTAPTSVAEVFDAAAEFVATHEWAQKPGVNCRFSFERGPWCAAMAVQKVVPDRWATDLAAQEAADELIDDAMDFAERRLGQRLIDWNDTEGRVKDDVITALRGAAAAARAEQ